MRVGDQNTMPGYGSRIQLAGRGGSGGGGGATFTEVGSGSQRATKASTAADSDTLAYPGSVTSGNLLICVGAAFDSGTNPVPPVVSSTRTTGNWTIMSAGNGTDTGLWIAYALATSSGACTVTTNPAGAVGTWTWGIDEFNAGALTIAVSVDGSAASSTGTGTSVTNNITTLTAGELIIGVMLQTGLDTTMTPGGSYTQFTEDENDTTNQCHNGVFRVATTATSYTVDWTLGASRTWRALTGSFKAT